jgi:hypothetical protein
MEFGQNFNPKTISFCTRVACFNCQSSINQRDGANSLRPMFSLVVICMTFAKVLFDLVAAILKVSRKVAAHTAMRVPPNCTELSANFF